MHQNEVRAAVQTSSPALGVTLRAVDPCNVRLACSGLLDERAGSVAGAGYLLVRELLARGIDIDFYAENGYTPMPESLAGPRFNYVGIERPRWMSLMSPRAFFLTSGFSPRSFSDPGRTSSVGCAGKAPGRSVRRCPFSGRSSALHDTGSSDGLLASGGTPDRGSSDSKVAVADRRQLRPRGLLRVGGVLLSETLLRSESAVIFRRSDLREQVDAKHARTARHRGGQNHRAAVPRRPARFVPPNKETVDWSQPEIVWLGRIVPRKRLDLLVDAMPSVATALSGRSLARRRRSGFWRRGTELAPGFAGARSDHLRARGGPRERAGASPASGGGRPDERERELRQRDRGGPGVWCAGGSRPHERHPRLHR